MILIDTSAWIDFFRDRGPLADRVDAALEADEAAWCGPIATELRRGFVSPGERSKTLALLEGCHFLSQPEALWEEAGDLGFFLRRKGFTAKTLDLVIATYALSHRVQLLTRDRDFQMMRRKGVPLLLVSS